MPWSNDARVLRSPFRVYEELARSASNSPWKDLAARVFFLLFTLGAFVSLTSAGRLVPFHVVSTMVFWSFVPVVEGAAFLIARHATRASKDAEIALPDALGLYFTGHAPWLLFLMLVAGTCLFAPDVFAAFVALLRSGVLIIAMLVAQIACGVLTYACFRSGLGRTRARAALATAIHYVAFVAIVVGYYLALNQIQPQTSWGAPP